MTMETPKSTDIKKYLAQQNERKDQEITDFKK